MKFNKAYRRYPYHTLIKYIGDKTFIQTCIRYTFEEMHWEDLFVSKGSEGIVTGFIFDSNDQTNVIGLEVEFLTNDWNLVGFSPIELKFGEDLFVRTF